MRDNEFEVEIRVLLGTQSVRTAAPPRPSRSTTVTDAPRWAATRAASYPPGPPPRITTDVPCSFTRPIQPPNSSAAAAWLVPRQTVTPQPPAVNRRERLWDARDTTSYFWALGASLRG